MASGLLPRVVRIHRKGGKILQSCDVYIGRAVKKGGWKLDASIWANPFKRTKGLAPGSTLLAYEQYVRSNPNLMHRIPLLAGKTLGCWCKPNPCHGDVLVKLVQEHLESEDFEDVPDIDDKEAEDNFNDSEQHDWSKDNKPASVLVEGVIIGTTTTLCECYGNFRWTFNPTSSFS